MLKVAICEDEQPIGEYLKELTEQCIDSQVRIFETGEELLNCRTEFDVILLDISLSKEKEEDRLNGMEVARRIRQKSDAVIIFVTALREYVFEGYDVGAFHYLLKPVEERKFQEVMERAARQIQKQQREEAFVIKTEGGYVKIPVKNIVYAENEARKIILHTKNMKESSYAFYEKMEALENRLGETFFRSHRGFLINLAEVSRYDSANIFMKNGESVYLSKRKYNDFVTAYMKYLRE